MDHKIHLRTVYLSSARLCLQAYYHNCQTYFWHYYRRFVVWFNWSDMFLVPWQVLIQPKEQRSNKEFKAIGSSKHCQAAYPICILQPPDRWADNPQIYELGVDFWIQFAPGIASNSWDAIIIMQIYITQHLKLSVRGFFYEWFRGVCSRCGQIAPPRCIAFNEKLVSGWYTSSYMICNSSGTGNGSVWYTICKYIPCLCSFNNTR